MAKAALPLMQGRNAPVLTLTYLGAERVVPNYNTMAWLRPRSKPACATWPPFWARAASALTVSRPA